MVAIANWGSCFGSTGSGIGLFMVRIIVIACLLSSSFLPVVTGTALGEPLDSARRAAQGGNSAQAVELLGAVIAEDPQNSTAYYLRGREHFRLGKIAESVADF